MKKKFLEFIQSPEKTLLFFSDAVAILGAIFISILTHFTAGMLFVIIYVCIRKIAMR